MLPRVIFLTMKGGLQGHEFEICGKARCVVGRGQDCELRLPASDLTVSRRHCLLDVDPPAITLYDLSLNGTYVNGEKALPARRTAEGELAPQGQPLTAGDEIEVGETTLRVWIVDPPAAEGAAGGEEPVAELCGAC
jgi:pSer/pThr/pTyr-binding forkhead associated (FHA) protein